MNLHAKGNRHLADTRFSFRGDPRRWRRAMRLLRIRQLRQGIPPARAGFTPKVLRAMYATSRADLAVNRLD